MTATDTITPLPHGPLRNAVEAGAVAVGLRAHLFAAKRLRIGHVLPADAAWLTERLDHYRNLCALAGIEPQAHWVERITEAIDKGQGS